MMASAASPTEVTLRLYCHGLGDCHLLGLPGADGPVWMMIDCGIHSSANGGADKIRAVERDVLATTQGKLAVVVGTHEHWDHNSAFHSSANLFGSEFDVGEVWLGWTENPSDAQGQQLDKFKDDALDALTQVSKSMPKTPSAQGIAQGIDSLLNFSFGLKGEKSRDARNRLRDLAKAPSGTPNPPRYLEPGDVVTIPRVSAVRCYVLAPPRDPKLLGLVDSQTFTYSAAASRPVLGALAGGLAVNAGTLDLDEDPWSPFEQHEGVDLKTARGSAEFLANHYLNDPWRTIDSDWLMTGSDLALQLDSKTNNTSLVLAFEIVDSGHVLIFAADAQVGNWKSWAGVKFAGAPGRPAVTGADLLARAVFYKVGHHGSRNATLKEGGLELMTQLEVAFNPTDEAMAKKVRWNDIPCVKLNEELERRTTKRLIQSDRPWITDASLDVPIREGGSLRKISRADGPSIECIFI